MNTTETARLFDQASAQRPVGGIVSSPDLDHYRRYIAHLDMPEARKDDMMLAVYRIVQSFVDRAFGDDPVQRSGYLADKAHGKNEPAALPVIESPNSYSCNAVQPLDDVFHRHVIGENQKEKKR